MTYADTATDYWQAGWRGVLPLPPGKKFPPPDGWTGRSAPEPSMPDVTAWCEDKPGANVALRAPTGVLGIDVDAYGDKRGAVTLADLERRCGALPRTWWSTSRDDGMSGIRWFRIPEDYESVGALPGIELIQHHHRYAVVFPSVHPDTGRRYRWVAPGGGGVDGIGPKVDELPALPAAWLDGLRPNSGNSTNKDDLGNDEVWQLYRRWCTNDDPCTAVTNELTAAIKALRHGGMSRHETVLPSQAGLVRLGERGHPGAHTALETLRDVFLAALNGDRDGSSEYRRGVAGAVQLVSADPTPGDAKGCTCDDGMRAVAQRGWQNRRKLIVGNAPEAAEWLRVTVGTGQLAGMFGRGGEIVHTPRVGEEGYIPLARDTDDDGPAQVRPISAAGITARVQYSYYCHREDTKTKTVDGHKTEYTVETPVMFPASAGRTVVEAPDMLPNLRPLSGVVHSPLPRADGTVLHDPGYDPTTGLLHLPEAGLEVPPVPAAPTPGQVAAAVALLDHMTEGFRFVTDHDKANYYGLLLTPLLREIIPPPYKLGAIGAPQPGSGKTLLATLLRHLHGGVFRSEVPSDEAEFGKQITTILDVTTGPVVHFDNVTGVLRSAKLAGLLTSNRWDDRRLGSNTEVSRPNDRLWVITGNNLSLGGDLTRRTLWVTIDPGVPDPHLRTGFAIDDLEDWVRTNRGRLLHALLTLIAAWVAAGSPTRQRGGDGYARWIGAVDGILDTAGVPGRFDDPGSVRQQVGTDDDDWADFLAAAHGAFGERPWTVKELLEQIHTGTTVYPKPVPLEALPADLGDKIARSGSPSVIGKSLGMWLRNRDGRWAGGYTVRRASTDRVKMATWRIETA